MNYTITPDRSRLVLLVDEDERAELRELGEAIHTDACMSDFLFPIVSNSELDWVYPEWTGDLTSAPMLGIADWNIEPPVVIERWAWMDYAVRSLLEELRDKGTATLVGGPLH